MRAGAGVGFVLGFFAFFHAFYLQDFSYLKWLLPFLLFDFFAKVFLGTQWAPLSIVGEWVVKKQTPDYVGAIQKRFAWSIGLILASVMVVTVFLLGSVSLVNLVICAVCLLFMFMESAFGICVGCKMYALLIKYRLITEPVYRPVCPGNVCAIE